LRFGRNTHIEILAEYAYLIGNPANDTYTPLQLPSVKHNSSCDGCARDAEENRMRKKSWSKKRTQEKKK